MRVFIRSFGRAQTISTHLWLSGVDFRIVVHSEAERAAYCKNRTIDPGVVIVSGEPSGPLGGAAQIAFILESLAESGEWVAILDDDFRHPTRVRDDLYPLQELPTQTKDRAYWKAVFSEPCSGAQFFRELAPEMVARASVRGFHLCGVSSTDNHYFRGKHWRYGGFVPGALAMYKKDGLFRPRRDIGLDDYYASAENHRLYGGVVVNNWFWHDALTFTEGGQGPYAGARQAQRRKDCEALLGMYPGLLRPKERRGFEDGTDLAFRLTTPEQFRKWFDKARLTRRGGG